MADLYTIKCSTVRIASDLSLRRVAFHHRPCKHGPPHFASDFFHSIRATIMEKPLLYGYLPQWASIAFRREFAGRCLGQAPPQPS